MAEQDLGEVKLPTQEEIAKLPRWAQVAFAARCARRVQPLFGKRMEWAAGQFRAVDATIECAEIAAALAEPVSDKHAEANAAFRMAYSALDSADDASFHWVKASIGSARAAFKSALSSTEDPAHEALSACRAAIGAAARFHPKLPREEAQYQGENLELKARIASAIRNDLELITGLAHAEGWRDSTAVSSGFFGPIWPDGAPEDWPAESAETEHESALRLHFSIPAEVDKDEADRIVQEIMLAASELHVAYGGSGLILKDKLKVYEPALVPAGGDE